MAVVPDVVKRDPANQQYSVNQNDVIQLIAQFLATSAAPTDMTTQAPNGNDTWANTLTKAVSAYVEALGSNANAGAGSGAGATLR